MPAEIDLTRLPPFEPGMRLCEAFYREAVRPIVERRFGVAHSAGLLDFGSDVLGFDTPQSRDHGWGPRCTIFLGNADAERLGPQIVRALGEELPFGFHGYPTNWADNLLQPTDTRPVNHRMHVTSLSRFLRAGIGAASPWRAVDWLAMPPQRLRTIASGGVFHDGLGTLADMRRALAWYPHDVWLYLMSCQWSRIGQEEPFMARCGDVGDELGSRLVAARLVDEAMRVAFLIERQYPPYYKWFGTAFSRLQCAAELAPALMAALGGPTWKEREKHLSAVYMILGRMHNALGVTEEVEVRIAPFHTRPYRVPDADRFADALRRAIGSEEVKGWPKNVGAVGQFANSTDVLDDPERCRRLLGVYGA